MDLLFSSADGNVRGRRAVRLPSGRTRAALALAVLGSFASPAGAVTFETRVLSGQTAPETSFPVIFPVRFAGFDTPAINEAGQVAFLADLSGVTVVDGNDRGLYSEAAGSIGDPGYIAREGDAASVSAPGVTFGDLTFSGVLNDAGQTAFRSLLNDPSATDGTRASLWSEAVGSIGSPGAVALAGASAPGTPTGVRYRNFGRFDLNNAGQSAFEARLTGTGITLSNDTAVYSEALGSIGSPAIVARAGNLVPALGSGLVYALLISPIPINDAGQTAFLSFVDNAPTDQDVVLFSEAVGSPGAPGVAAREGFPAPGNGPGVEYGGFGFSGEGFNNAGQLVFRASLQGTGVDAANDSAVFSEAAGSIGSPAPIAREGDAAPGTAPGVVYGLANAPVINNAGQTAFFIRLTGTGVDDTNNGALFSESFGSIGSPALVVREGDAAPGTAPGVTFGSFGTPVLNDAGQLAFSAELIVPGAGPGDGNQLGVWVAGPDGAIDLIARLGDLFDVDDDPNTQDIRTISAIYNLSGESDDGEVQLPLPSINDLGQIALNLGFTDGTSGIFVADTVALGLEGDYNVDRVVNLADYTVWRDNLGAPAGTLLNDPNAGAIGPAQYQTWKSNFGQVAMANSPVAVAVPEPAGYMLLVYGFVPFGLRTRRPT